MMGKKNLYGSKSVYFQPQSFDNIQMETYGGNGAPYE